MHFSPFACSESILVAFWVETLHLSSSWQWWDARHSTRKPFRQLRVTSFDILCLAWCRDSKQDVNGIFMVERYEWIMQMSGWDSWNVFNSNAKSQWTLVARAILRIISWLCLLLVARSDLCKASFSCKASKHSLACLCLWRLCFSECELHSCMLNSIK